MTSSEGKRIRTFSEFEKTYYPRSYEEKKRKEIQDPKELGIQLAEDFLKQIESQLR